MTANISEFSLDRVYNVFEIQREETAVRMAVSQVYRTFLRQENAPTPAERRDAAIAKTGFCLGCNYKFFRDYGEDFLKHCPDVDLPALKTAVIIGGFYDRSTIVPHDSVRAEVVQILDEAEAMYHGGPPILGEHKRPASLFVVHTMMLGELTQYDGRKWSADDVEELSDVLGTTLHGFEKAVLPQLQIGMEVYKRMIALEAIAVDILKEHGRTKINRKPMLVLNPDN